MWPRTFDGRLAYWANLRDQASTVPLDQALLMINQWWFGTPWCAYHLHWDDFDTWPDPWQLLEDNIFCDLARGLGIMYTVALINRPDLQQTRLVEIGTDNLVLVSDEKYILNWDRDQIVNINLTLNQIRHSVDQQKIQQRIQ